MKEDNLKQILNEIKKYSKLTSLSVNEIRVIFALEGIVRRLQSHNKLKACLVYKGGFVLMKSYLSDRFTRDLDALAENISKSEIVDFVKEALQADVEDGINFGILETEDLQDQGKYGGFRINVPFQIGEMPVDLNKQKKLSRVHIDIGFGDIVPGIIESTLPQIIRGVGSDINWITYSLESIFAEKLETIISRGSGNSRAKDFYDIVFLFDKISDSEMLIKNIREVFNHRNTDLPDSFFEFIEDLDFEILEVAWGSVQLSSRNMLFEECIRRSEKIFTTIDKLMKEF